MYIKKKAIPLVGALLLLAAVVLASTARPQASLSGDLGSYDTWSRLPDEFKLGYLMGYAQSKQFYRYILTNKIPLTEEGRRVVDQMENINPLPTRANFGQIRDGIDQFYKDFRNRKISFTGAKRIVFLHLVGRPDVERISDSPELLHRGAR